MNRLRLSVLTFLIVLLSVATTTYAWISMAQVNTLKDISLNAVTGYDLLMSLDGENYYEEIPMELIDKKINKLLFNNVTSRDGVKFNRHFVDEQEAIKNTDYLSLTFYFKTSSRYTEIHLADNLKDIKYSETDEKVEGTYITSRGKMFTSNYKFLYDIDDYVEVGETREYFAKDAMRVSFTNLENDVTKIFDLSEDENRSFGKEYGAYSYFVEVNNKFIDIPIPPKTIYELSDFEKDAPLALNNNSHIVTLNKTDELAPNGYDYYSVGAVKMNVWLEGFDADAFDSIYKDQLKMQFMFKAVLPSTEELNEGE